MTLDFGQSEGKGKSDGFVALRNRDPNNPDIRVYTGSDLVPDGEGGDPYAANAKMEYSVSYAPYCTLAAIEGIDTGIGEPWQGSYELAQALVEHSARQDEAVARVRDKQSRFWKF